MDVLTTELREVEVWWMRCRRMGFASNHSDDSDGLDNKELGPQHRRWFGGWWGRRLRFWVLRLGHLSSWRRGILRSDGLY